MRVAGLRRFTPARLTTVLLAGREVASSGMADQSLSERPVRPSSRRSPSRLPRSATARLESVISPRRTRSLSGILFPTPGSAFQDLTTALKVQGWGSPVRGQPGQRPFDCPPGSGWPTPIGGRRSRRRRRRTAPEYAGRHPTGPVSHRRGPGCATPTHDIGVVVEGPAVGDIKRTLLAHQRGPRRTGRVPGGWRRVRRSPSWGPCRVAARRRDEARRRRSGARRCGFAPARTAPAPRRGAHARAALPTLWRRSLLRGHARAGDEAEGAATLDELRVISDGPNRLFPGSAAGGDYVELAGAHAFPGDIPPRGGSRSAFVGRLP